MKTLLHKPRSHLPALLAIWIATVGLGGSPVRHARAPSQEPARRAENLRFEVAEGGIVRIFYDLVADNPQELVGVRLVVSQDGGRTHDITASSVTGDVGPAVLPGPGKRITWEAARDVERLDTVRLRFRIVVGVLAVAREPRRFWGVSAGFVPEWRMPGRMGPYLFDGEPVDFVGSELRIGIVRGGDMVSEWGISLVRRKPKIGAALVRESPDSPAAARSTTAYSVTAESGWITGVEVHTFRPFLRIRKRGQLGALFAAGLSGNPDGTVQRNTAGTIYASNPRGFPLPSVVPAGPGFVLDYRGQVVPVAPGETAAVDQVAATDMYGGSIGNILRVRAELAARFAIHPRLSVRVSGGLNFPALQLFSVEVVHLFGSSSTGR